MPGMTSPDNGWHNNSHGSFVPVFSDLVTNLNAPSRSNNFAGTPRMAGFVTRLRFKQLASSPSTRGIWRNRTFRRAGSSWSPYCFLPSAVLRLFRTGTSVSAQSRKPPVPESRRRWFSLVFLPAPVITMVKTPRERRVNAAIVRPRFNVRFLIDNCINPGTPP